MQPPALTAALEQALAGHRLLDHPFYRRWEAGQLAEGELAAYAAQYGHVERALPGTLAGLVRALPSGPARAAVAANLADELGRPRAHLALFGDFAAAVGAGAAAPTPATAALLDTYRSAAGAGPAAGLATVAAYEVQAAEVARTKADGLRTHYGVGPAGTAFWEVHAGLEEDHAGWTVAALAAVAADPGEVARAAGASARAWWAFLDEREAAAA